MVVLNEGLVKSKTKLEKLGDVKNLNVCGQGIDDVAILQDTPNIEVLSLSVNKISSLRHFAFCSQLQQLYLRANAVTDLAELRYLMGLQHLRVLWLADNPCTKLRHYRAVVVANLPQLENLDSVAVNDADRQAARGIQQLQPATAADVLAEDLAAAAAADAAAGQQAEQAQVNHQAGSGGSPARGVSLSPPSSARLQLLPATSPYAAASAVPLAAAHAGAAPGPQRGSSAAAPLTPRGASPELIGDPMGGLCQPDSSSSAALGGFSSGEQGRHPSSARVAARATPTPTAVPAAPSAASSYRGYSPEPPPEQQGRSFSVTPRDLGRASCSGVEVAPGQRGDAGDSCASVARALQHQQYNQQQQWQQQQQEQGRVWLGGPAEAEPQPRATPGMPSFPPQRQHLGLAAGSGHCYHPSSSSAAPSGSGRTNVLYAVMALLGELDVSGLSIVQREVQMRLEQQQQQQQQQH